MAKGPSPGDIRRVLRRAGEQGLLLGPNRNPRLVRHVPTGRVVMCSWSDCTHPGDDRVQFQVPHESPRWVDKTTGKQEMVVYIFCSERHKQMWVDGSQYAKKSNLA